MIAGLIASFSRRGRQIIAKTLPVHLAIVKESMGTLPPGDLRRLQQLLGRLNHRSAA